MIYTIIYNNKKYHVLGIVDERGIFGESEFLYSLFGKVFPMLDI